MGELFEFKPCLSLMKNIAMCDSRPHTQFSTSENHLNSAYLSLPLSTA